VRAEVSVRVGTASLVLNRASYKGTLVAHASSRLQKGAWDGQLVRLVMTEKPGQKAQCAMMIVGADTSKAIVKRFDFKGTEGASG